MPFNTIDKGIQYENKHHKSGIRHGRIHARLGTGGHGRLVETDGSNQRR